MLPPRPDPAAAPAANPGPARADAATNDPPALPGLRVLMTNAHLDGRNGTPLWIRDVAAGLLRRGLAPVVYSPRLGEVAREIRALTIPVVDDLDALAAPPDLIHGHHHLETMTALLRFPAAPAIFFSHSWHYWQEAPPRFPRLVRYAVVSDTVRDRLVAEHGIPPELVRTIPNFVDLARFPPRAETAPRPRRALLFGNEPTAAYRDAVEDACAARGIPLDLAGTGLGTPVARPEAILPRYDLVFAIDRCAIEAAASGAAVVVAGPDGLGELLTVENFAALRRVNFGHRAQTRPPTPPLLGAEIDRYDPAATRAVAALMRREASLDAALDQIVRLYADALAAAAGRERDPVAEERATARYLRWFSANSPKGLLDDLRRVDAERSRLAGEHADLTETLRRLRAEQDGRPADRAGDPKPRADESRRRPLRRAPAAAAAAIGDRLSFALAEARRRYAEVLAAEVAAPGPTASAAPGATLATAPGATAAADVRLIAFYLPQFYPTPENDAWWGPGFTEWTNVAKARPLFPGHDQPRLPADLGFYDLRLAESRQAQAALARAYGLHGFCYYHYWFAGKRFLARPFDEVLGTGRPDFPFCLCWANHHWTRRWDGREEDVLQPQTYSRDDDAAHIAWLLPALRDRRAITIEGRPVFLVYYANRLPEPERTVETWRRAVAKAGLPGIYLIAVETDQDAGWDATRVGFDAKIGRQPSFKALFTTPRAAIAGKPHLRVYDYEAAWPVLANPQPVGYRRYPTVFPGWDNSARVGDQATVVHNATPAAYEAWLRQAIDRARQEPPDHRVVFVNAWNEWGEGNHLEPDARHGHAFLQATRRALAAPRPEPEGAR